MQGSDLSRSDAKLHAISIAIFAAICAAIAFLVWESRSWGGGPAKPDAPDNDDVVEASLAYKKTETKQPQKPKSEPPPEVKPEGVSHDEKKPVTEPPKKKPDDAKAKPDVDPMKEYQKHHRVNTDDDNQVGEVKHDDGEWNGSEFGYASKTTGDPFGQEFVGDLLDAGGDYPSLSSDVGTPVGCVRFDASGKVVDTKFKVKSGNADFDRWVEDALSGFQKMRNKDPKPPPDPKWTEKWQCYKFAV